MGDKNDGGVVMVVVVVGVCASLSGWVGGWVGEGGCSLPSRTGLGCYRLRLLAGFAVRSQFGLQDAAVIIADVEFAHAA